MQPSLTAYRRHLLRHRERWLIKRNCLALLLPKKGGQVILFPKGLSPVLRWDGTPHTQSTRALPGSLHFQTKICRRVGSKQAAQSGLQESQGSPSPTTLWSLLTSSALQSATQQRIKFCVSKLGYTELWL